MLNISIFDNVILPKHQQQSSSLFWTADSFIERKALDRRPDCLHYQRSLACPHLPSGKKVERQVYRVPPTPCPDSCSNLNGLSAKPPDNKTKVAVYLKFSMNILPSSQTAW